MSDCVRSITFLIPGKNGAPGVQVYAEETAGGQIKFVLDVLQVSNGNGSSPGDLRGLFFDVVDESKLAGLAYSGSALITAFDTFDVIDLGNGANMHGAANPFDVGLRFGTPGKAKDDIQHVEFTLSNSAGNLTLDDIAHVQFGARSTSAGAKLTTISPAAPDAVDDEYDIFEDGASGLDDPRDTPQGVLMQVLDNDTDADGDKLAITEVHEFTAGGHAEIVDGDDADSDPGDAILYFPFMDYSGVEIFEYCITDNNGGTDFANVTVNITAVADVPDVTYEIIPGTEVNEFTIRVTAAQTDFDSSEFIDRIETSALPAGVTLNTTTVNPGDEPDQIVYDFVVTLPLNTDTDFDLTFTAWSEETSNADQQSGSVAVPIVLEFNTTTTPTEFLAEDQSIWSTGEEVVLTDDRFIGVDTGNFSNTLGSVLYAHLDGHIKVGLQSTLTFEGGEIDATADYDITVDTNYNKTTDQLLIDTSALLTAASMTTEGPQGSYQLDFVWDFLLNAYAGINIDFGSIDFDPLGVIPGDQTLDLGGIQEETDHLTVGPKVGEFNLINLESEELNGTIDFPPPVNFLSVYFDWPEITTSGTFPPNPVESDGMSPNFLGLVLDMDQLVANLAFGGANPIDPPRIDIGPFFADLDFLDVDITGGVNLLQEFTMDLGGLTGILHFEDESFQAFAIGSSLLINDASLIDANGDGDGFVEFDFTVVPTASLQNQTDLGFNIGVDVNLLLVQLGYDITIPNPFGDDVHRSDSINLGPVWSGGAVVPLGSVPVFDDPPFELAFDSENVLFFA